MDVGIFAALYVVMLGFVLGIIAENTWHSDMRGEGVRVGHGVVAILGAKVVAIIYMVATSSTPFASICLAIGFIMSGYVGSRAA